MDNQTPKRTDTLRLTNEFSEKLFKETLQQIDITELAIIMDDIRNYRPLTEEQFVQIKNMNESDKIKIITTYNRVFETLEDAIRP